MKREPIFNTSAFIFEKYSDIHSCTSAGTMTEMRLPVRSGQWKWQAREWCHWHNNERLWYVP